MIVVNFDEVFELTVWAVEMESKVEVFRGTFLFVSFDWRSRRFIELVFENTHNLVIVAFRTEKEEMVRYAGSAP